MATAIEVPEAEVEVASGRVALGEKLFQAVLGVWDVYSVYLGDRLGLYAALAAVEPATPAELAARAGMAERYVREWLEQQTVSGILACENPEAAATDRRFAFPPGHCEALTDVDDPGYIAPLAQITVGAVAPLGPLLGAFRSGAGVPYEQYGADLRDGQAGMNRNLFLQQLGTDYLPAIRDLDERLRSDPPARIADIGCGIGWSSVGMAAAYPIARVDGFDLDEASVEEAQAVIAAAGVGDRVEIALRDVADPALAGRY
ncbi:MAG TPA: class I SAM-dependent methyltransferase, partial [Thermomicrobiales bacterium]|nr:class I SAM-dependent methyltransferase [Thermomicrobiales bacterium]